MSKPLLNASLAQLIHCRKAHRAAAEAGAVAVDVLVHVHVLVQAVPVPVRAADDSFFAPIFST